MQKQSGIMKSFLSMRPEIILFIISLGVSAYFVQYNGWNQNSRLDLVQAMVEDQTFIIDKYHENTQDKSKRGDHYYSDKAPGAAWLAVIPYSIAYLFAGENESVPYEFGMYICSVFAISIPSAFSVSFIFLLFRMMLLPMRISVGLSLAYAFGTLTLPYSTMFFGHQLSAALIIISFAMMYRIKLNGLPEIKQNFIIGVLLGYSFVSDYTSILASVTLLIYFGIILKWSWKLGKWVFAGIGVPAILMMYYNFVAFGGILSFSYHFSTFSDIHHEFMQGLTLPKLEVPYMILFSSYRGLFFYSPWLLLAIPGISLMLKRKDFRLEGILCLAIFLIYVAFNSSYWAWHGGWVFGPRFIILSIPFLALAAGALWLPPLQPESELAKNSSNSKNFFKQNIFGNLSANKFVFIATSVYSVFIIGMATLVHPLLPETNYEPLKTLWSGLIKGHFVPTLGKWMGLHGWNSIIPLLIFSLVTGYWLYKSISRS